MNFFEELKRRNVFRVAIAYIITSWLLAQVLELIFDSFGTPDWVMKSILVLMAVGFIFVSIFSWVYELTAEGIKRESEIDRSASVTQTTSRKLDRAIIFVLVLAVGYFIWESRFAQRAAESPPVSPTAAQTLAEAPDLGSSIAVLPLINMSAIDDNAFFAGGVHEDILTNLAQIQGLKVISRTSVMRYVNSDMSLRDIGLELGARYIVEGSVRRVNNHVRVTVQLIDASNDTHLWANNYDRELVDVFATQSAVAKSISDSLHLEIQPDTVGNLNNMPTDNVKAYDLYMRAVSIDRSEPQSEQGLTRTRALLEQAVEEDPGFVEAWGFLNEILDHSIRQLIAESWFVPEGADQDAIYKELRNQSQLALNKAVALDPDNVETLLARASDSVAEQNADFRAERKKVIDYTIELYPDNAMAWYVLGWWYNLDLDNEAAKPAFQKALDLDPLHLRIVEGSLNHFRLANDQEMVTLLFERIAQIAPEIGEDKRWGKTAIEGRLFSIEEALVETADESFIDTYADTINVDRELFLDDLTEWNAMARLSEMQNNLDALLEMQGDMSLGEHPNFYVLSYYLDTISSLLAAQRIAGQTDNVRALAGHILDTEQYPAFHDTRINAQNHAVLARAYAAKGDEDKSREWADKLLNERDESYNSYGLAGFAALAETDTDAAVELVLQEKAQHPTWTGTDIIATFHITYRNIVTHPEMQAYYLDEGKWINYLAKRVPEYSKYSGSE
jgi:TolB-like protein